MFPKAEREWIYSTHFTPNEYRNERLLMEIVRIKSVDSRQRQRKEAIPLFDRPIAEQTCKKMTITVQRWLVERTFG
jgi:hypothetical protein